MNILCRHGQIHPVDQPFLKGRMAYCTRKESVQPVMMCVCLKRCADYEAGAEEVLPYVPQKIEPLVPQARCQHATITDSLAIPARPCQGRKVICGHPTAGLGSVPEKRCGNGRCKFYTLPER